MSKPFLNSMSDCTDDTIIEDQPETPTTTTIIETQTTVITGLPSIDNIICGFYPSINHSSKEEIHTIAELIKAFIFKNNSILEIIQERTNEATSEFIEGLKLLAQEQQIKTMEEFQTHFDYYYQSFDVHKVCKCDSIDR
ncbi:MAG: hypothetical protein AAGG75_02825 [Bacteroidota bacterium]